METQSSTESVEVQKGRSIFLVMELTRTKDGLSLYLKSKPLGDWIVSRARTAAESATACHTSRHGPDSYGVKRKGWNVDLSPLANTRAAGVTAINLGWGHQSLFYDGDMSRPNVGFFLGEGLAEGFTIKLVCPATRKDCEHWVMKVKEVCKAFYRSNLSPFNVACELMEVPSGEEA